MTIKRTLFSTLFLLAACGVEVPDTQRTFGDAQVGCSSQVPEGALVVRDGDQAELVDAEQAVLVCPGGTLVSHGGDTRVWVLSGGEANINGGYSDVAAEGDATIVINADNVRVFEDGGSSITENGQRTDVTACDAVVIDTSMTEGC